MTEHPGQPGAPERDLFGKPAPTGNWAHRRGEPRLFALLWTIYLMLATALMFGSLAGAQQVSSDVYRPAARVLMALIVIGAVVLWPMTRLSQLPPDRPARSVASDIIVLLLPAQALIWPQIILAAWPGAVVLALSLTLLIWTVLFGAILTLALRHIRTHRVGGRGTSLARAGWMLVVVAVCSLGPVWSLTRPDPAMTDPGQRLEPAAGLMFSPVSAALEVVRDRSATGRAAWISDVHWSAIKGVGGVALAAWIVVGLAGLIQRTDPA